MKRILIHLLLPIALLAAPLSAGAQTPWQYDPDVYNDENIYQTIYNDEWMYAIWRFDRELPPGWETTGVRGLKIEMLAYIDRMWTDKRPLSVRRYTNPTDRCIVANLPPHKCQS